MVQIFKLDDKEYEIDHLSEAGKSKLSALKFVTERIEEHKNHKALLQRAKKSYINTLKKEMLSDKAGILFDDN